MNGPHELGGRAGRPAKAEADLIRDPDVRIVTPHTADTTLRNPKPIENIIRQNPEPPQIGKNIIF